METLAIKKRIQWLSEKITYYNQRYYLEDTSEISDYEFDLLLSELQKLEKEHPEFVLADSPTLRVGGGISKVFPVVPHIYPMLSLANTYEKEELIAFDERVKKGIGQESPEYTCELKFDGVAIGIRYSEGLFEKAITRGDGDKGDDVSLNVKTIKEIPLRISNPIQPFFEVRGEIYMNHQRFQALNEEIEIENAQRKKDGKKELPRLANPRNTASGTLKMQDSSQVAKRGLNAFIYEIYGEQLPFDSHSSALEALKEQGFPVSEHFKCCGNIDEVWDFIQLWDRKRSMLPFDIDGMVVKVNSYAHRKVLGMTAKSPRWAVAYKYKAEKAETKLLSVDYQVGRTGKVTPVANLKPVSLSGTTVKRASIHNANEIARLDLHLGDTVSIEKGGEIIPKITQVILEKRELNAKKIDFPTQCPECHTDLVRIEGEADFYCTNSYECTPQRKGRIEHFVSRNAMDIDSLGGKTIEMLFDRGMVKEIPDLFKLKREDLLTLPNFKEKSVQNILEGIERSKASKTFKDVLFGLGIRHIGQTVAEKLANHFRNLENLRTASRESLLEVPEIGEKTTDSLLDFFASSDNQRQLYELISLGLHVEEPENISKSLSNKLEGLTFVITGVFEKHSREEMKELVESHAGKTLSGVSAKLSYLLTGTNVGPSKLEKAQKLGVKILTEDEFLELIKTD